MITVPRGDLQFNQAPGVKATSHASDTTKLVSVRRKPIRSSGGMIPLSKGGANPHRMVGIQANLSRGNCKGAGGHQQNYIPSLEYFTKGTLLKIPEQSNHPNSKVLTGNKLDPILSPDQVSCIIIPLIAGCLSLETCCQCHMSQLGLRVMM